MNIEKINQYILDCIDNDAYDVECNSDTEKLQFLMNTFIKEAWFHNNIKRHETKQNCFQEWIAGLPTVYTVDFSNYDIWNRAIELELLKPNPTDKQIEAFLANWFRIIAFRTFVLMRKNGVQTA